MVSLLQYGKQRKSFDVLVREKPSMMLIYLNISPKQNIYASSLTKSTGCTYTYVNKILKKMEEDGLITSQRRGRKKFLKLTSKGTEIAENLQRISDILKS